MAAELLLGEPLFPGDSGVDQLVEIIKASLVNELCLCALRQSCSRTTFRSRKTILSLPLTRTEMLEREVGVKGDWRVVIPLVCLWCPSTVPVSSLFTLGRLLPRVALYRIHVSSRLPWSPAGSDCSSSVQHCVAVVLRKYSFYYCTAVNMLWKYTTKPFLEWVPWKSSVSRTVRGGSRDKKYEVVDNVICVCLPWLRCWGPRRERRSVR